MTDLSLGDVDRHLDFEYGADTTAYQSCGATLDGDMFVLGGFYQKRQVNKGYIKIQKTEK